MAIVDVKVPQLSESVAEATMLNWKKKPGEAVAQDEILIEIETDKVVLEVPAPSAGVLSQIIKNDGDTVVADEVIAKIDTEATAGAAAPAAAAPAPAAAAAAPAAAAPAPAAAGAIAMPSAAKLMAEGGLSASQVAGTGKDGRITKGDVLAAGSAPAPAAKAAPAPAPAKPALPQVAAQVDFAALGDRPEERVPMSRLRARIAERLIQSQSTNAILTTFNEVNMKPVMDLRAKYKDRFEKEHGVKLGFMSFFVKAAIEALREFPQVNAEIRGEDVVYRNYFDVGIAVGGGKGLVVPILRNAERMSFAEVELAIADFGKRAQANQLTLDELTGGTFTISNGGIYGSLLSTPILNPPQSGILGLHAIQERPVARDGQVVIRPMMYVALSYDHRVVDGREAVTFLRRIKECLEDPARMLLEV